MCGYVEIVDRYCCARSFFSTILHSCANHSLSTLCRRRQYMQEVHRTPAFSRLYDVSSLPLYRTYSGQLTLRRLSFFWRKRLKMHSHNFKNSCSTSATKSVLLQRHPLRGSGCWKHFRSTMSSQNGYTNYLALAGLAVRKIVCKWLFSLVRTCFCRRTCSLSK